MTREMLTERLLLRPWRCEDLDDLYAYSHCDEVGPMAGWRPHATREEAEKALAKYVTHELHWALVWRENGRVIGAVKLNPDTNRGKFYAKAISFVLSPAYWGRGLMTEAVKAVIDYAFSEIGIDLLSAFHYAGNDRSRRVLEKCGFEYEITFKNMVTRYDGRVFDMVCYCILAEDYKKRAAHGGAELA